MGIIVNLKSSMNLDAIMPNTSKLLAMPVKFIAGGTFFATYTKKITLTLVLFVNIILSAHAQTTTQHSIKITTRSPAVNVSELANIRVTKYELALVQVMAEICPQMLNERQKRRFFEAYENQLRVFIPHANNPKQVLEYLGSQRDYRAVLQSVRAWTASFPVSENRELCVDFANIGRTL